MSYKKNRFKRIKRVQSTGALLSKVMEEHGGQMLKKRMELWAQWDELMGPEIAGLASPIEAKGTTIILGAKDNMALQEIHMHSFFILQRANNFLGEQFFKRLSFSLMQGRKPLSGRPEVEPAQPFQVAKAPPLPPADFGGLKNKLDPESPVGKCYLAIHRLYFPPNKA